MNKVVPEKRPCRQYVDTFIFAAVQPHHLRSNLFTSLTRLANRLFFLSSPFNINITKTNQNQTKRAHPIIKYQSTELVHIMLFV